MRSELFVLPEKTRKDFREAFVLTREELGVIGRISPSETDADLWYDEACLWERMSPDLPRVSMEAALEKISSVAGKVLFLSDSPDDGGRGVFWFRGRPVVDFVAMVDGRELAERIRLEWGSDGEESILPDTLYVFDTTFEWVAVFTGETDPVLGRMCMVFGL